MSLELQSNRYLGEVCVRGEPWKNHVPAPSRSLLISHLVDSQVRMEPRLTSYRVYYLPLPMLHHAISIARPNLVSLGTCFGKFSKTGKFKLGITCLDWLAKYAKYKVSLCSFAYWRVGDIGGLQGFAHER